MRQGHLLCRHPFTAEGSEIHASLVYVMKDKSAAEGGGQGLCIYLCDPTIPGWVPTYTFSQHHSALHYTTPPLTSLGTTLHHHSYHSALHHHSHHSSLHCTTTHITRHYTAPPLISLGTAHHHSTPLGTTTPLIPLSSAPPIPCVVFTL